MKGNNASTLLKDEPRPQSGAGHGEKLPRKEQAAIIGLLAHPTIPEAAKAAGISETTLWRWLQRDDFREKYREAQNKVFEDALVSLQGATLEAVNCLRRNLKSENPWVAVHSSRVLLHHGLKAREIFDLEDRIARLEAELKAREEAEADARSFGQDDD
jgi:hypothetical protein